MVASNQKNAYCSLVQCLSNFAIFLCIALLFLRAQLVSFDSQISWAQGQWPTLHIGNPGLAFRIRLGLRHKMFSFLLQRISWRQAANNSQCLFVLKHVALRKHQVFSSYCTKFFIGNRNRRARAPCAHLRLLKTWCLLKHLRLLKLGFVYGGFQCSLSKGYELAAFPP